MLASGLANCRHYLRRVNFAHANGRVMRHRIHQRVAEHLHVPPFHLRHRRRVLGRRVCTDDATRFAMERLTRIPPLPGLASPFRVP